MKILLNHYGNRGYGADQVTGMSLAALRDAVAEAIEEWGEDTEVVTYQTNNGRGASYGVFADEYELFTAAEDDDD
ncbi:hypothetical protein SEA_DAEGAL_3 [Mycobacterium phage Daegal]|uniref:Uncharacterized protein n=1 Tax=Mycobacterium phage Daegal TaxID=2517946 RepID=A0A482MDF6_9CAUD|nr:hypothetical protein SEA_DAEGAL_3 [Mycobacterium phage Daegal]